MKRLLFIVTLALLIGVRGGVHAVEPSAVEALPTTNPTTQWAEADIRASRVVQCAPSTLPDKPVFAAAPLNLIMVVEAGDHHVSVLDGDKLEVIGRSPIRAGLQGGPKFSPSGRYAYFGSRDGWVSKYDLWTLKVVSEVRVGITTGNLAISNDGKWLMVGNELPRSVVLLDSELKLLKTIPTTNLAGDRSSRVSAVYDASPRNSFIVAFKDMPELWEVSYDPKAEPIFDGFVHDYRMKEGIAKPGYMNPRRTPLDHALEDLFFEGSSANVVGATRPDDHGVSKGQVVNLNVRRKIADLALPGLPHFGASIAFDWKGHRVIATPNLTEGVLTVIDTKDWKTVTNIKTLGPGCFVSSHEKSRYAFTDALMSPTSSDTVIAIDKESLSIAAQLRPEPGKHFGNMALTRDGRYAVGSLMEMNGEVIVYDTQTLKEVRRLSMRKPAGIYNVWNTINWPGNAGDCVGHSAKF